MNAIDVMTNLTLALLNLLGYSIALILPAFIVSCGMEIARCPQSEYEYKYRLAFYLSLSLICAVIAERYYLEWAIASLPMDFIYHFIYQELKDLK